MTGLRAAQAQLTRDRVVAAARILFTEKGYFETTTRDVVNAAEVGTRGAFYHHFPDKRSLFVVVFEDIERDLVVRGGTSLSGSTGLERLTTGLESFLDASLEADVRRIVLIDGPAVLGWESWQEIQGRYGLGAIRGLLREGAADGSVSATASEALAHLLFAACNDAALFIANADRPIKARGEAGAALRALLAGLQQS